MLKLIYITIGIIVMTFSACIQIYPIPEVRDEKVVKVTEYDAIITAIDRPKHFDVDIYIPDLNWRIKEVGNSKHFNNWRKIKLGDTIRVDVYSMKGISTRNHRDTSWIQLESDYRINQKIRKIYQ